MYLSLFFLFVFFASIYKSVIWIVILPRPAALMSTVGSSRMQWPCCVTSVETPSWIWNQQTNKVHHVCVVQIVLQFFFVCFCLFCICFKSVVLVLFFSRSYFPFCCVFVLLPFWPAATLHNTGLFCVVCIQKSLIRLMQVQHCSPTAALQNYCSREKKVSSEKLSATPASCVFQRIC